MYRQLLLQNDESCWHVSWILKHYLQELSKELAVVELSRANQPSPPTVLPEEPEETQVEVDTARPRSLNAQFAQVVEAATAEGSSSNRRTRRATASVTHIQPTLLTGTSTNFAIEKTYEVEALLSKRFNEKKLIAEYLVKWKNWGHHWNSWENIENLLCEELLEDFEKKLAKTADADVVVKAEPLQTPERFLKTRYFVLAYGFGYKNHFCVVGPDRDGTVFRCKDVSHSSLPQHCFHVSQVMKGFSLDIPEQKKELLTILPNFRKNINTLKTVSRDSTVEDEPLGELQSSAALLFKKIFLQLDESTLHMMSSFNIVLANGHHLKPETLDVPESCTCLQPLAYESVD